jgi:peptidoglycan/LPS O-acetylase OafA/YrhL
MGLLRLILAIAVITTHASPIFGLSSVGGLIAVQTFYIISGFYMTLILNEKYKTPDSYKLFITNRLLRLYPIYWTVIILIFILSFIALKEHHGYYAGLLDYYYKYFIKENMAWVTFILLMLSNIFIIGQDWLMFTGYHRANGILEYTPNYAMYDPPINKFMLIPQAWTLGVEISFYLIAPFIVRRGIKTILWIIFPLIILRIAFMTFGLNFDPWSYRFFPAEMLFFLMGTVSYHLYTHFRTKTIPAWQLWTILGVVMLLTIGYEWIPLTYYVRKFSYNIIVMLAIPFLFILTKNIKWDRWIGELSYPLYIVHMLFVSATSVHLVPIIEGRGTTVMIFSLISAILLNKFIAEPVEKIRQARVRKAAES